MQERKTYAVYQGDAYITSGYIHEVARTLGVSTSRIYTLASKTRSVIAKGGRRFRKEGGVDVYTYGDYQAPDKQWHDDVSFMDYERKTCKE